MHIIEWDDHRYVVAGVHRDESNSSRLMVLGTWTPNSGVVMLFYQAVR
jgi:hypothetical protein